MILIAVFGLGSGCSVVTASRSEGAPPGIPAVSEAATPGTFVDRFDDGVVGAEYAPVGEARLVEAGGFLRVLQSGADGGVEITPPRQVGGEDLLAYCLRFGLDVAQLARPGDRFVFRAFENPERIRWEIIKVDDTTYDYKVFKDGQLSVQGRARIPAGTRGFRIDKKPGTRLIIGEVVFPDGSFETLFERDPPGPELPFTSLIITSSLPEFRLSYAMAGLHTDLPTTEGAVGDLRVVPPEAGGVVLQPVGADRYDVQVTVESAAVFATREDARFAVALEVGDPPRVVSTTIECRGSGRGTCRGQGGCEAKICPDREYDLGDGQGFRPFVGTCSAPRLGLPVCSCSYRPKVTFRGVEIRPGESLGVVVDPDGAIPELIERDNRVTLSPTLEAFAALRDYRCDPTPGGRRRVQGTLRVASGHFDPRSVGAAATQLFPVGPEGVRGDPLPLSGAGFDDRVALLRFDAELPPGAPCPQQLVLTGASPGTGGTFFWSAVAEARVVSDRELAELAAALFDQLEEFPPEAMELGTLRLTPNPVTGRLITLGDLGLPTVLERLAAGSPVQRPYAAFASGEIGNRRAIPVLRRVRAEVTAKRSPEVLDFTLLGEIADALRKLEGQDDPPPGQDGPGGSDAPPPHRPPVDLPPDRCCVTAAEVVTAGAFQGGKKLADYFPDLVTPGTGDRSPYWSGAGATAGGFDLGTRTGAAVQLVGTVEGTRARCSITQHFVIERSNFPGAGRPYGDTAPVGQRTDDIAKSGRDSSRPPFRQDIGTDKISFADPPSRPYGPGSTFSRKQRFESCFVSLPTSQPACTWMRCCATWILEQDVRAGTATSTVRNIGSFCEK
jgi:hypothetical protein